MSNLSDRYFEEFIKNETKVTFTLLGKETITGVIKEKGKFALVVEVKGRPILLFKHAIHSIEVPKVWKIEDQKIKEEADRISKLPSKDRVKELEKTFKKIDQRKLDKKK